MKRIYKLLVLTLAFLITVSCITPAFSIVLIDEVKNVIIMIGDGMGENHLEWTKSELGVELEMDKLPYQGYSKTDSLSGLTDSAAGGTALSCGLHCFNSNLGTLSLLINGHGATAFNYMNVSEAALKIGKKAGIVTSDVNSGATPASFSVHTYKRELTEEITKQQAECNLDLIWAADNGVSDKKMFEDNGWTYSTTEDELKELDKNKRSFAAIKGNIFYDTGDENDAPLSELTALAIERLDNESGFFLMVEGAHIDKNSHSNIKDGMMNSLVEFDKAVKCAVDFAKEDGNTIVIVTADHETGAITKDENGQYGFTSGDHSKADVPLRLFGSDGLVKDGEHAVNKEVGKFIAKKLGYTERFPVMTFNPDFFKELFSAVIASIKD